MLLIIVLALIQIAFFPKGCIDFAQFEEPNLLIADYEGTANCHRIIKLKPDQKFVYVFSCFDYREYKGTYVKRGDTIWFNYEQNSPKGDDDFAIIRYQNAQPSLLDYYSPKVHRHAITKRIILLDTVTLK